MLSFLNIYIYILFFSNLLLFSYPSFEYNRSESLIFQDSLERNIVSSNKFISDAILTNEEIIYFEELQDDFESGENGWSLSAGWEITSQSSSSGSNSLLSQNNDFNKNVIMFSYLWCHHPLRLFPHIRGGSSLSSSIGYTIPTP